jgi:DNA-binding ferritin-like protein
MVAHSAHNNCHSASFFSDHDFFESAYSTYQNAYDSLVERYIGKEKAPVSAIDLMKEAMSLAPDLDPRDVASHFDYLLMLERTVCSMCNKICNQEELSEGTKQLVGELCNQSEIRQYKIHQRLS